MLSAKEPITARHAMVVAEEPLAVDAGVAVLKAGGNAIDAAVAVGFALAVTHPFAGNLGGGGFMLVRFAGGQSTFIDFRERAPASSSRDMYLGPDGLPTRDSIDGWRASGVPGTVRGLELAQSKYGRKKWAELIAPSIELASKGFALSAKAAESFRDSPNLALDPESSRIFLDNGKYFAAGDKLVQPELAATLRRIAKSGAREFYEGQTARRLSAEMKKHGGLVTLSDLKDYSVVERTPLTGHYHDYTIITAPLPSSGGIGILQMLGMLEGSGYEKSGAGSAGAVHYVTEVMRRFFADRGQYLGDPDFVKVPAQSLLDPAYIRKRRDSIDPDHATASDQLQPGLPASRESLETTHYSIMDEEGNAVSVTYTLNNGYGSGVTVPGLGFLLNDEMDDFTAKPGVPNLFGLVQGEANAIQPGKRPLSAMTPTIILRTDAAGTAKPYMVLGAPGGPRIITSVLQVILNVLDFHMNIQAAVDAPRFHHQWKPDSLILEDGFSPETIAQLKARGHQIESTPGVVLARVEAILAENGLLFGAADSRWVGKASGY